MENQKIENNITLEELKDFFKRITGKNQNGESKSVISYQSYNYDADEDSTEKTTIYQLTNAYCSLSFDRLYPQYITFEIYFQSCDDTELKLLWGRLQRHLKNQRENPEKRWVFYFNILEKESISDDISINDTLSIGHIMNPIMTFITREMPSMLSEEFIYQGDLMGGNILKMLIPIELFSYEISNEYDTSKIKGEARMEDQSMEYLDNYEDTKWDQL